MSKKSLIQTAIIVSCFLASGLVLYNGFFKNSSQIDLPVFETTAPVATEKKPQEILPHGSSLNFDNVLKKFNQQYGVVTYPKLSPATEVGKQPIDLLVPEGAAGGQ